MLSLLQRLSVPLRGTRALLAVLGLLASAQAAPIISEFMAANAAALRDEDGAFSDWLELHNPDGSPVDLNGWYLTDSASNKTKWRLPAVVLGPGEYLVVFASNKNRTDPAGPLHTNFALSASGEYLGLIKPDGETTAFEYAPQFPAQSDDVSYGAVTRDDGSLAVGFLRQPTPGRANGGPGALMLAETVTFSRPSMPFTGSIVLELGGAGPGQKIRYEAHSGANAGEAPLSAQSPEYTGPITLNGSAFIRAAVFSADDSMQGAAASAHYLRVGDTLANFSSRLPILVLDTLGAGSLQNDDEDHASWAYGYAATDGSPATLTTAPAHRTPLLSTVRGNSSAEFPKKGYNLKLRDSRGGKRELPLFQLPAYERWALVAPWSFDQNYINNPFVYGLSNRLGRWAARTQLVEVFVNGDGGDLDASDYAGIYVLTDRIETAPGRVDIPALSPSDNTEPAITGGYIVKIDTPDAKEVSWRTNANLPDDTFSGVVLVAPDEDDVTPEQVSYIKDYVQRMEDALRRDRDTGWAQRTYLDYIDRASWVDHHLLNVFVSNPDSFVRSAYFHKPRGGKLLAGPVWDFDRALGGNWDYRGDTARTWSGSIEPDVDFWRSNWFGILASDPEFRQDWIDRWQALRRTELSNRSVLGLVDTLADTIGPAAAARDAARWPDNLPPSGTHAGQIAELKTWLRTRAEWIDAQFVAPPTVAESGGSLTFTPPVDTQLAYTEDGSDPRSLGGALAPNARLVSGPLTIPNATNIQVRSYRASMRDAFPATSWSSAVAGPSSTPLRPVARIINLSTRGMVGFAEDALVAGVVVADTEAKRFLVRAIGPGLGVFGATGFVPQPQLSVFGADGTELQRNNGWETSPDAERIPAISRSVGAFPLQAGSPDSVVIATLPGGPSTVEASSGPGESGIGLAEVYELDGNGRTVNLSTRATLRGTENALIGGFVLSGPAHKRLLIRAVGPTLSQLGVTNTLGDPVLTVFSGSRVVASNDRWDEAANASAVATASKNVGAFALAEGGDDAALLITLAPGAYTVEARGKDGAEGVVLLEIYDVP